MKEEKAASKRMKQEVYLPPCIEVIEMAAEGGVMTGSATGGATIPGYGDGGSMFGSTPAARTRPYNSGSASDIEDMINDILTIEQ